MFVVAVGDRFAFDHIDIELAEYIDVKFRFEFPHLFLFLFVQLQKLRYSFFEDGQSVIIAVDQNILGVDLNTILHSFSSRNMASELWTVLANNFEIEFVELSACDDVGSSLELFFEVVFISFGCENHYSLWNVFIGGEEDSPYFFVLEDPFLDVLSFAAFYFADLQNDPV